MDTEIFERTEEELIENLAYIIWKHGYHIDGYPNLNELLKTVDMKREDFTIKMLQSAQFKVKKETIKATGFPTTVIPPSPFKVTLTSGKVLVSSDYIPTEKRINMKLTKTQAVKLLIGTGHSEEVVDTMSVKRMTAKLNGLKDFDEVTVPEDPETKELYDQMMKVLEAGELVEVEGDNSESPVQAAKKEKKKKKDLNDCIEEVEEKIANDEAASEHTEEDSPYVSENKEISEERDCESETVPNKKNKVKKASKEKALGAEKTEKAPKEKKEKGEKKPGVCQAIEEELRNASKTSPVTKEQIFEAVHAKFPDREEKALKSSVQTHVCHLVSGKYKDKGRLALKSDKGFWMQKTEKKKK